MVEIRYSKELLKDFDDLLKDYLQFMTFNLIHADSGLQGDCANKVLELISFSNKSSKKFNPFFEYPLLNFETKNKEKMMKNISNLIKFLYDYLVYAEPILKRCKPELYGGRFSSLKENYSIFSKKYIS